jgi:hypothetical protein
MDEKIVCKNCDSLAEGNFCSSCGQKTNIHRIDWHYILHEIPHSVWHLDKGIIHTFLQLLTRPGYAIIDFFEGKRKRHYSPLGFLIINLAIYAIFFYKFMTPEVWSHFNERFSNNSSSNFSLGWTNFYTKNMKIIQISLLPLHAFCFWLFFPKNRFNYPEHLTAITFLTGMSSILGIITVLVYPLSSYNYKIIDKLDIPVSLISYVYFIWAYTQLYSTMKWWKAIFRSVGALALNYILFSILGVLFYLFVFGGFKVLKQDLNKIQKKEKVSKEKHK